MAQTSGTDLMIRNFFLRQSHACLNEIDVFNRFYNMRFQKVKEVSNSINICWMFHSFIRTQHKLAHSKKVYYISIKYSIVYIYI